MAELLIVVAAALIDGDGRVLIAQRRAGSSHGGMWEFPGGKLERGESPEEGLVRELKEELEIDVSAACLAPIAFSSCISGDVHLLMPLFACRKWKGSPRPVAAEQLAWVMPKEFHNYPMPPADKPLAAQLRDIL